MLHNSVTDNLVTLFCIEDGDFTPFSVDMDSSKTVDHLKVLPKKDLKDISLADVPLNSKEELDETDDLSDVFKETPPKKTIYTIVQRPRPASTPLPGYLSDQSRPRHAAVWRSPYRHQKDHGQVFAPGPIANFHSAFVKGEGALPITSGSIRGLPRAWRRTFGHPPDIAIASTSYSSSSTITGGGLAGGVARRAQRFELLSQHWGFYLDASHEDWGSGLERKRVREEMGQGPDGCKEVVDENHEVMLEYVQDGDDDFWQDKSRGNTDSNEDEYADEIDIGGTRVYPVPVMRQICESNQYGEMLSRAAQFGRPYLALGDQERQTANTIKGPTMDSSNSASNPQ
ncbi:hypothetical protein BGZ97_008703 [Linnemannia gamsii]|uniref:Uncharacterized protein n=1 Tax=Linnemannia gamsii TaxID=64522 RepID=A0A9P6UQK7_9FUNG|nr:hypothetical protein BGZ97_008703 [Linnemannia gamsii]